MRDGDAVAGLEHVEEHVAHRIAGALVHRRALGERLVGQHVRADARVKRRVVRQLQVGDVVARDSFLAHGAQRGGQPHVRDVRVLEGARADRLDPVLVEGQVAHGLAGLRIRQRAEVRALEGARADLDVEDHPAGADRLGHLDDRERDAILERASAERDGRRRHPAVGALPHHDRFQRRAALEGVLPNRGIARGAVRQGGLPEVDAPEGDAILEGAGPDARELAVRRDDDLLQARQALERIAGNEPPELRDGHLRHARVARDHAPRGGWDVLVFEGELTRQTVVRERVVGHAEPHPLGEGVGLYLVILEAAAAQDDLVDRRVQERNLRDQIVLERRSSHRVQGHRERERAADHVAFERGDADRGELRVLEAEKGGELRGQADVIPRAAGERALVHPFEG